MRRLKTLAINLTISIVVSLVCLVLCEIVFRKILFSTADNFSHIRKPGNYASPFSDDYWKLYYLFDGNSKPPENPHPLLGWKGAFSRNSLIHNNSLELNKRRPILLYGDSYAQCTQGVLCFEDILNQDTLFNKSNYLLNYGVGGYGVDQIYLLMKNSLDSYTQPMIVFSIFMDDLNRSILKVRIGPKPYFEMESDSLTLKGVPLPENPEEFFISNPPEINSNFWNS